MNRMRLFTVLVVALSALPLVTLAGPAHADLLYQSDVDVSITTIRFQAFSFSFTVPTFVTAGQSPAFTPFTVTAGTHSYKMINDLAGMAGSVGCFEFNTGGSAFFIPPCNFSTGSTDGNGAFKLAIGSGLPTATGLQNLLPFPESLGLFGTGGSTYSAEFGGTLDITSVTSVPEPASLALPSLGVVAVGWRLRKRRGVA